MSKVQMLRAFVNQRLTAAAEEIFELFEGTIAEYEEQLHRSKEENERQHKLLDAVFNPEVRLQGSGDEQLMVRKEEVHPEQQQKGSFSVNQEDRTEPPHVKEDQEELWSQEGEQLQEPEEADINKFTYFPVAVKSEEEDDEEKPQSSQFEQTLTDQIRDEYSKTEAKGEDCEGSDPDFNPDIHIQPVTDEETSQSSDNDDRGDWEASNSLEGLNPVQNKDVPVSDMNCNTGNTSVRIITEEPPFICAICGKSFSKPLLLRRHSIIHTGEKAFSCSVCGKRSARNGDLRRHLAVHTGEKPLSCSVCGKRFAQNGDLRRHLAVHTGEKPFSCSVCGKRFAQNGHLRLHLVVHTGEKPFSCSVCGKRFAQNGHLKRHLVVHTGNKTFGCSVCCKKFSRLDCAKRHRLVCERRKIQNA